MNEINCFNGICGFGSRFRVLEMVICNSLLELKEVSFETCSGPDAQSLGGIFFSETILKARELSYFCITILLESQRNSVIPKE